MARPTPVALGDLKATVVRGPREGRWYWRIRRYQDGTEETLWTGWASPAEILTALAEQQLRPRAAPEEVEIRTLGDLLDYWLGAQQDRADLSPHTIRNNRQAARHLLRTIGATPVEVVSTLTADRHVRARLGGSPRAAPRTIQAELSALRQALRWAQESQIYSGPLPRARIEGASRPTYSRYTPTADETGALLAVLRERADWLYRAVVLAWTTGARPGEVGHLRWGDVDREAGRIAVGRHRGAAKTGERTIPLAPEVAEELRAWWAADQVRGRGLSATVHGASPETVRGCYRRLRLACAEAGIPPLSWQAFRRSATDRLYDAGVDPGTEAALLGHSVVTALRAYRGVRQRQLQEAAVQLGLDPPAQIPGTTGAKPRRS